GSGAGDQTSTMTVKGPSLVRSTDICAPNTPVATSAPSSRNSLTTASTSGSATVPGAAACHVGRRPLRASPSRVNWLITSRGAPRSEQDFSPSRIRSVHSFLASVAACSTVSVWVAPTRTISPGPVICPTTSPSTATDACDTRCATARMFWSPSSFLRLELVQHPQSSGVGDDSGEGHHKSTDGVGEVLDAPLARPGVPMQTVSVEFFGAEIGEGGTGQEVGPAVDVVEYDRVRQVARVQFHAPTWWGVLGAWAEQVVTKTHGVRVHGAAQLGLGRHV